MYKEILNRIIDKESKNVIIIGDSFPYNDVNGKYEITTPQAWTNGYYPGLLWINYLASGKKIFKETAIKLEKKLDDVINSFSMPGHDVGFVWLLSSGINYAQDKNEDSRRRLINMATYLAGRFNLKGNYIRAWDGADGDANVPMLAIIDCTMNLPLLFKVSRITGDPRFSHIAKAHADTVLKYFIDEDGAARHICRFNAENGEFVEAIGGQGYASDSAWSRGAGWAIYGLAMVYEYTNEKKYLDAAEKVAKFFVSQLGEDYVPAWDFRAPNKEIKDSSAGAIAASGMIEIYKHTKDKFYKVEAEKLIKALYENCWIDDRQALLGRATAHFSGNENIEVGLIYGDYYFAEAVYKLASNTNCLLWEN